MTHTRIAQLSARLALLALAGVCVCPSDAWADQAGAAAFAPPSAPASPASPAPAAKPGGDAGGTSGQPKAKPTTAGKPTKPAAPAKPSAFAATVLAHFEAWDRNHDGLLAPDEVEHAVVDPSNTGDAAAALAALHGRYWKAEGEAKKSLAKGWFADFLAGRNPEATNAERSPELAGHDDDKDSEKDLEVRFNSARSAIKNTKRVLFDADGPNLADCKQGALGDCYFIAPLAVYAERRPGDVVRMFTPLPVTPAHPEVGGMPWYTVTWGDGVKVEVSPLTDGELGLSGASMKSGLWVRMLEKAYGLRRLKPEQRDELVARDEIGRGGTGSLTIRALTGHQTVGIRLIGDFKKPLNDELRAKLDPILTQLRKTLPEALGKKMLMSVGTPESVPPSISPKHLYAITGFDAKADTVTLWNPHGSSFTPKPAQVAATGSENMQTGWKREKGYLKMKLEDFARVFGRVAIETDKPQPQGGGGK